MGSAYRPVQAEIMRNGALFLGDGGACDADARLEVRNPDDMERRTGTCRTWTSPARPAAC
ncbi:MAG: hypothetical protein R2838_15925 [Caldilineaceae bacterium]